MSLAQPKFKKTLTQKFDKPEAIAARCDVHGWMSGWLFVAANPYFKVTDNSGSYKLTDVSARRLHPGGVAWDAGQAV
ncbi:MAG: hypothetical protein ACXWWP_08075 [Candidatus Binatia bacterium]